MTVWVFRNGVLVEKRRRKQEPSMFPTPMISRLEPYESPIDGKEITSWAQRDKDLRDSNSYDPRDFRETPHAEPRRPRQLDLFADPGE